jgi:hypothetical protein
VCVINLVACHKLQSQEDIYFSCFCLIKSVVTGSFAGAVVCAFPSSSSSSSSSSSPILELEEEFVREKKRSSHIIDGVLTD